MSSAAPRTRPTAAADRAGRAPCTDQTEVFQSPLLEEPVATKAPAAVRRHRSALKRQAALTCRDCPLLASCLYDAVVRHDVAGYAAGTTAADRAKIRAALGTTVGSENLDTLAGVPGGNRPVDHEEVVRLRAAHPDESLERLAQRLGCSLSTVKRHLRRARGVDPTTDTPTARLPSVAEVLAAARDVLDPDRREGSAAA